MISYMLPLPGSKTWIDLQINSPNYGFDIITIDNTVLSWENLDKGYRKLINKIVNNHNVHIKIQRFNRRVHQ